jgi:hypothetical protein
MDKLVHCIYTSAATEGLGLEALASLLANARRRNEAAHITGMLLYSDGGFFQILEGAAVDVDACFGRILKDPRHTKVTRIIRESISRRDFGDWSMGYSEMTPETLQQIDGLNDFFTTGSCFDRLDSSRAKKVLRAFAAGRWRSTLSGTPTGQASR